LLWLLAARKKMLLLLLRHQSLKLLRPLRLPRLLTLLLRPLLPLRTLLLPLRLLLRLLRKPLRLLPLLRNNQLFLIRKPAFGPVFFRPYLIGGTKKPASRAGFFGWSLVTSARR
jgi:hypothetical protein